MWYESAGKQGIEPAGDLKRVLEIWEETQITADEAKRDELAKEIFRINLANLWTIGTVGGTPLEMGMVVVKNNFRNVPESPPDRHVFNEDSVHTQASIIPAQYFFKQRKTGTETASGLGAPGAAPRSSFSRPLRYS